jgi:hypothetical protein
MDSNELNKAKTGFKGCLRLWNVPFGYNRSEQGAWLLLRRKKEPEVIRVRRPRWRRVVRFCNRLINDGLMSDQLARGDSEEH